MVSEYNADEETIDLKQGSIDSKDIHEKIVDIMEGGEEVVASAWQAAKNRGGGI